MPLVQEQEKIVEELVGLPLFAEVPKSIEKYQEAIFTAYVKGQFRCDEKLHPPDDILLVQARKNMVKEADSRFRAVYSSQLPANIFEYQNAVRGAFAAGWLVGAVDKAQATYDEKLFTAGITPKF